MFTGCRDGFLDSVECNKCSNKALCCKLNNNFFAQHQIYSIMANFTASWSSFAAYWAMMLK